MDNDAIRQRAKFIPAIGAAFAIVIYLSFSADVGVIGPVIIVVIIISIAMVFMR